MESPSRPLLPVLLAVHTALAAVVWRDLARRPAAEVRGPKVLWRVLSAANTSGQLAYLLVGRRRSRTAG